ncbi:hypothetical protein [Kitasatospora sp. NPDC001527]|uniref:hypothetical protein n=1 Tax=Kitasatospora sp. NPDC001527 TaxID=3154519 RepID=UPI00332BACF8
MVQVRVMGDDAARVRDVLAVLLPYLERCPDLVLGDTTELGHRGGGGRVVFDLSLPRSAAGSTTAGSPADDPPGSVWVRSERADRAARPARQGLGGRRRALPPGGSR